ncbi:ImmA/IrrE family metallo-endopeptidase, partial [Acinetobacter baumannii]|uniref:ImmA/IrrE family metallo-endopeptidase n=1 Tax=Acinetobacter baumannii TaxID=470 RepID=UPI000E08FB84
PKYSIPSVESVKNFQDIENAALQFRKYFNLGLGPMSDMNQLTEMLGIFVTTFPSVTSEDNALSIASKRQIFVKNKISRTCRQRFNLAHELGHLVLQD